MLQHPFLIEDELRRSAAERLLRAERLRKLDAGRCAPWRRHLARLLLIIACRLDQTIAQGGVRLGRDAGLE